MLTFDKALYCMFMAEVIKIPYKYCLLYCAWAVAPYKNFEYMQVKQILFGYKSEKNWSSHVSSSILQQMIIKWFLINPGYTIYL